MADHAHFLLNRLRERLWVKPLIACVLSVAGVLVAHLVDNVDVDVEVPDIAADSIVELLKVIAASMLGVATFAVASMVAAYASAGQAATARAFPLIVADDVSQNALSAFIGAFIFAIVALSAVTNHFFGRLGRFALFVLVLLALAVVVLVFVRWVDRIARLGRLSAVLAKVERATAQAMKQQRQRPCLGGVLAMGPPCGASFHGSSTGFLQRVDMAALQDLANKHAIRITLGVVPGAMALPSRPLGYLRPDVPGDPVPELESLHKAFLIGPTRKFDEDPRFGLVVLAEIASRALSPGVNDPGTAIGVLSSLQRLFVAWDGKAEQAEPEYDRIEVPDISVGDMFDDVFPAIARDGASLVEVAMRLQRVLGELGRCASPQMAAAARQHAALAMARAELALQFAPDLAQLRRRHADYWDTPTNDICHAPRDSG